MSLILTSCLSAMKNHVNNKKNLFCSIKNSGEILNKLSSILVCLHMDSVSSILAPITTNLVCFFHVLQCVRSK